ncbi:MAG: ParB N-terminal domain-containing protein [Acidobacteriaceae bacterium]|nr:ParB N-terminal domain-containing protein [Acidobacteriaceae bacterium]
MVNQTNAGHAEDTVDSNTRSPLRPAQDHQTHLARVPIASLQAADSPRLSGENLEHARILAESGATLPPIIVHRASLRVIDGMHRLRAAMLRKQDEIDVLFFEGDDEDAFILAVKANVSHGLPLSRADRSAAATRIIHTHPQWSDRRIAAISGLSPKTIAAIRLRYSSDVNQQSNIRIGHDGRIRPVNSAEGRRIAAKFIAANPDAALRTIANAAGISPATARDIRTEMRNSGNPTFPCQRRHDDNESNNDKLPRNTLQHSFSKSGKAILTSLKRDPSLRCTEAGRALLRLLDTNTIDSEKWLHLIDNVPAHCATRIADVARQCAESWHYLAQQVERRQGTPEGRSAQEQPINAPEFNFEPGHEQRTRSRRPQALPHEPT